MQPNWQYEPEVGILYEYGVVTFILSLHDIQIMKPPSRLQTADHASKSISAVDMLQGDQGAQDSVIQTPLQLCLPVLASPCHHCQCMHYRWCGCLREQCITHIQAALDSWIVIQDRVHAMTGVHRLDGDQ